MSSLVLFSRSSDMSEEKNLDNQINDQSNSIPRSMSSARFQIAKVSDDESNSKVLLDNASSIPISK